MEFFYVGFKKNIYFWIQHFYFGKKQKYLWKHCYTVKKPWKNRANIPKRNYCILWPTCNSWQLLLKYWFLAKHLSNLYIPPLETRQSILSCPPGSYLVLPMGKHVKSRLFYFLVPRLSTMFKGHFKNLKGYFSWPVC